MILRLRLWAVAVAVSVALLFACLAVEKFCRASSAGPPTALAIKFRESDRVGRRGLSEPGGIFSRLLSYVKSAAVSAAVSVALQLAFPAVEKFCRASSAGGRLHLQ